ncbi:MAG: ribonuclease activity regulator RraA [Thermomicrobiaceae bacterium]
MVDNSSEFRLSDTTKQLLTQASTATISSVLRKLGYDRMFLEGLHPLRPEMSMVGRAFTLRFVPTRPDLDPTGEFDNTTNNQRIAVESVGPGDVLVIEARDNTSAGTLGDILATRIWKRGAAGIVSDGAFRDTPGVAEIEMPTYSRAQNPNLSSAVHHPIELNGVIVCAGVTVLPGDVIVGDAEGVIVIPAALADQVAEQAHEQEQRETFIMSKIRDGHSILGVYPPDDDTLAEYEKSRGRS